MCFPDMFTFDVFLAMMVIMPITWCLHCLLWEHGKNHHVSLGERGRIRERSLYLLAGFTALLIGGQTNNACLHPSWQVTALVFIGLAIWECVYALLAPPPERKRG